MPYCDEKKIIFLHVPKTGGTTIKRIFDISLFHDSNPATSPSPQHFTCNMLEERIGHQKYSDYYKFAFVRNPWSRILSSYFWRQTLPKERPVLPFEDFIGNVAQIVAKKNYYSQEFGDHFIPQTEFTSDVNDIFKFEDFEASIATIAAKTGIVINKIPPKKAKHYDDYTKFYNKETRQIIAKIYKTEISKFGYSFEI